MPPSVALTTMLAGLVDYAGLFPPAALSMPDAVARYGGYRREAHRAMLGRFVLPVARLDQFVSAAGALDRGPETSPWLLAVLASALDRPTLDVFNAAHGSRWRIDTIEAKASDVDGIAALAAAFGKRYVVYVEIPVDKDPSPLTAALAQHGLRAKIRTGGVTPEAFPAPDDVARFIGACHRQRAPFKATAGLHHPLRGEYPLTYDANATRGTMYGFLNVFLAATLVHGGVSEAAVVPLLEERDASAIALEGDAITWRGHRADAAQIAAAREHFAGSFGSCSFEEPVQDLAALNFLPRQQ